MRTEPRPWSTTYRNYSKELDVNSSGNILLKVLSSRVIEGTLNKQYWAMSFIAKRFHAQCPVPYPDNSPPGQFHTV